MGTMKVKLYLAKLTAIEGKMKNMINKSENIWIDFNGNCL